jgi:dihydroflavonol-4-reductase
MRAAVTGATGHLGANLVRALLSRGYEVRAITTELLCQPVRALDWLNVERVQGNVLDPIEISVAIEGAEVVYDLAPSGARGSANVVAACVANGISRLVVLTGADGPGDHLMKTGIDRGLDIVAMSVPEMIGPWDYIPSAAGRILIDVWEGRRSSDLRTLDFADVRDVADALIAAGERGETGRQYSFSRSEHARPFFETLEDTKRWFYDHGMLRPNPRLRVVAS